MSWNAKRSTKTTISKGLYQVSLSTFHADRKKIVNIIFWKLKQGKDSKILLHDSIADFFIQVFQKKKNCLNFVAFDL